MYLVAMQLDGQQLTYFWHQVAMPHHVLIRWSSPEGWFCVDYHVQLMLHFVRFWPSYNFQSLIE